MFIRSLAMAALVLAIGTAAADEMRGLDKQQFSAFDAQVKTDFQQGTRYKEISPVDQDKVMKTLAKMEDRWQKTDVDGKLNTNDTVEMANDQEIVTTILHHAAADSRLICNREVPMGTNIAVNICRTIAQIKREQNGSQNELRDMQKLPQAPQGH
ncbi:MAG TPA: hypothetical protein VGH80_09400 [Xanthomonadaceae bacterium]|jgi:hypothetical protein